MMLTTLWVMTIAAVVTMGAALVGRQAVLQGASRVELERGRWQALSCERRAIAAIDDVLRDAPTLQDATLAWRTLPLKVLGSSLLTRCDVVFEAAGTRLDVNAASAEMMVSLLNAVGLGDQAPEMTDALEDWIDADDDPRAMGVERQWYEGAGRLSPRNAPLAAIGELARVRGFESISGFDSVLTTEPGRVSLATAPVSVLMAVPGITRETAEQIVARQVAGEPINDLLSLLSAISAASASTLATRYPDAARVTTPDPDAWLIRARVSRGVPRVSVVLEWRVVRAGRRCVVARTRSAL